MLQTQHISDDSFCQHAMHACATDAHVQMGKTVMKNGSCDCYLEARISNLDAMCFSLKISLLQLQGIILQCVEREHLHVHLFI